MSTSTEKDFVITIVIPILSKIIFNNFCKILHLSGSPTASILDKPGSGQLVVPAGSDLALSCQVLYTHCCERN